MPLALPIELDSVNCYLVLGDDGITVVDPGWAWEEGEQPLVRALAAFDAGPPDVRRILATHQHWDHYSLACRWRREFGTHVALGREERHSIDDYEADAPPYLHQSELLRAGGAPELAAQMDAETRPVLERGLAFDRPDHWISDGERFDLGGVELSAVHTPGHTRGHVVFVDEKAGLALTGDHILPRITPSIAFENMADPLALVRYLESLRLFLDRPDLGMLPAHGLPQPSTAARAAELVAHHDERLAEIESHLAAGLTTAHDIAAAMPWTRHAKRLSDLGPLHAMTAILEVASHLQYLAHFDRASSTSRAGVAHYELA